MTRERSRLVLTLSMGVYSLSPTNDVILYLEADTLSRTLCRHIEGELLTMATRRTAAPSSETEKLNVKQFERKLNSSLIKKKKTKVIVLNLFSE